MHTHCCTLGIQANTSADKRVGWGERLKILHMIIASGFEQVVEALFIHPFIPQLFVGC